MRHRTNDRTLKTGNETLYKLPDFDVMKLLPDCS